MCYVVQTPASPAPKGGGRHSCGMIQPVPGVQNVFSWIGRRRSWLGGLALALAPRLAEAHVIGGSGNWTDELICAVPTGLMLVLVFILGRPTKKSPQKKPDK